MGPEFLPIMAVLMSVWGVAVAIKAANCLKKDEPYVFRLWDGGMIRVGKRLSKFGKQLKLVTGLLMTLGCLSLLTGAIPVMTTCYVLMFIGVFSVVSDFVTAEPG